MFLNNKGGQLMKTLKNKRGMTIVECVIAMTVIVIVSAAGATLIKMSISNTAVDIKLTEARVDVGNALEMFKACDESDFIAYMTASGFGGSTGSYIKMHGTVNVTIKIENDNKFTAVVTTQSGKQMSEVVYEKPQTDQNNQ